MAISAIVFLIGFVVGCILAFARHPVYGLVTYIVTLYMDPAGQWWGQGSLSSVRWELLPAIITLIAMLIYRRKSPTPVFRSGAFRGFIIFVAWIIIQLAWALDTNKQEQLLSIWSEFLLVSIMICGCVDSWKNLRLVLWAHVLGCVYMGWTAYSLYRGGRFEGFGLGSLAEANAGSLQLATGLVTAASLFFAGGWRIKAALFVAIGLIVDGIVATESRGGFLAVFGAGIAFNLFAPKVLRSRIFALSILGVIGGLMLTTSSYWHRIDTIEYAGANVPGVDTGAGRVAVIKAQWLMFKEHPFGCGHECTEILSPQYLASKYLVRGLGKRASHNTFMTMLVDHGIPGALLYIAMLVWFFAKIKALAPRARALGGFPAIVLPAFVGAIVAITIGDLFGQYVQFEARVWFISLIIVYAQLLAAEPSPSKNPGTETTRRLQVQAA